MSLYADRVHELRPEPDQGEKVASATLSVNTAITDSTGDSVRLDAHAVDAAGMRAQSTYATRPAMGANVGNTLVDRTFRLSFSRSHRLPRLQGVRVGRLGVDRVHAGCSVREWQAAHRPGAERESTVPPYIDIVLTK